MQLGGDLALSNVESIKIRINSFDYLCQRFGHILGLHQGLKHAFVEK